MKGLLQIHLSKSLPDTSVIHLAGWQAQAVRGSMQW